MAGRKLTFVYMWIIGICLCTLLHIQIPYAWAYHNMLVFYRGQIWRIFTAPFFFGDLDLRLIIRMIMDFMLIAELEKHTFMRSFTSIFYLFIVVCALVIIFSSILGSFDVCSSMLIAFVHMSLKLESRQHFIYEVMGRRFDIRAWFLAGISFLIDMVSGYSLVSWIVGMLSGHIALTYLVLWPMLNGRRPPAVPMIVQRIFGPVTGMQRGGAMVGVRETA